MTGLWRTDGPRRKTDALGLMKVIKSLHTAIEQGIIVETDNPQDARSKLVGLSADMRERLDGFFDAAVSILQRSGQEVEALGPVPKDS